MNHLQLLRRAVVRPLILAAAVSAAALDARANTVPVAVTGDALPGGVGTFVGFSQSGIALSNQVTFNASMAGLAATNKFGDVRFNADPLAAGSGSAIIARTGVDYGGGTLVEVAPGAIDPAGRMALPLQASGGYSVWRANDASAGSVIVTPLAQSGSAALGGGGTYGNANGSAINS